jgi:hypothetical protein
MLVLPPLPQFDVQRHLFACRAVAWLCWNVAATNSLDPTWKPTMPGEHRHACRQGRNLAGVSVKIGVFFVRKWRTAEFEDIGKRGYDLPQTLPQTQCVSLHFMSFPLISLPAQRWQLPISSQ